MRARLSVIVALAVLAAVAGVAGGFGLGRGRPALPVIGPATAVEADNQELNDMGDPFVAPVPAGVVGRQPGYVVYWTTDWSANVPAAVSTDLVHWRRVPDVLPVLPSWARVVSPPAFWGGAPAGVSTMTWGPTVRHVGSRWLLWYSTEAVPGRQCIGVASAPSALGPFVDRSPAPLVCQQSLGGDIDPSVVAGPSGALTLLWKNDGNSVGAPVGLWEQPLTSGGVGLVGRPRELLRADESWEHGIIEGPAMLGASGGGWWLFFSGGTWQSDHYETGVAWCRTTAGPCTEALAGPLPLGTPAAVSPGGLDTFAEWSGRLMAAYSAFPYAPPDARAAMAAPRVLELAPVLRH